MKSLDVIGGVYREFVVVPHHVALLGSAGRGVVAIGPERAAIKLYTALSSADEHDLLELANSNGFEAFVTSSARTMSFSYMHGLDPPRIYPSPFTIRDKPLIELDTDRVLCFSALDFDWRVTANQAVYDPQDAFGAKSFKATGSKAKRLALVLNEHEGRQITGKVATHDVLL